MAISNDTGAIVLTTGNKSEMATGYSTLYGDSAGGFAVIKDVPKTLVYELCRYRADQLQERIKAIEEVSDALFVEWETELELYSNRNLRSRSQQQLKKSRIQYQKLIKTLQTAQQRMEPVLAAFQDQVLFLKHNLNAHAIAALRQEFSVIGMDISRLIEAMEKTILEASAFVTVLVEQKQVPLLGRD